MAAAAALVCVAMACAAAWWGSLNQDEGWYLYAAKLVSEGKMPYRDFFYTQGPLLPLVYGALSSVWEGGGLLGARIFTFMFGLCGMVLFALLGGRLAPAGRRMQAGLATFVLLGCNLYHVYFNTIPKTYALGGLCVAIGFLYYAAAANPAAANTRKRAVAAVAAGFCLAMASGARISLGALLATTGLSLVLSRRRTGFAFVWFGLGGLAGLAMVYVPFAADAGAFDGLCAAQAYHAARKGFSPLFTAGSVSRLARWYLPAFVAAAAAATLLWKSRRNGCGGGTCAVGDGRTGTVLAGFAAVFAIQMLAPFPYEDYQVPVMGLFAAGVCALCAAHLPERLCSTAATAVFALAIITAAGSPLLEKWTTNGQDRFWTLKKEKSELAKLREAAGKIERLDPGGKTLFTQDLYLAVETGRKVPDGLEMGPFSIMSFDGWKKLVGSAPSPVAAMSGYTFAIDPPGCTERPAKEQLELWRLLREKYTLAETIDAFGQNSTTLLILARKEVEP